MGTFLQLLRDLWSFILALAALAVMLGFCFIFTCYPLTTTIVTIGAYATYVGYKDDKRKREERASRAADIENMRNRDSL